MAIGKRILLFLLTNMLIIGLVTLITNIFGIKPYLSANGMDYQSLALFCLIWGMVGSFVSLMLSKFMAKKFMGVQIVEPGGSYNELVQMVHTLSRKAGIQKMPEVGIFESSDINAFATGPSKNNSLVAVSTGLLQHMDRDEVEGVIGHEVAHIANGDMVTMTLLQGVMNAFVMFLARAIAFAIDNFLRSDDEEGGGLGGLAYFAVVFVLEITFGILASIVVNYFSRYREFQADKGGARLAGKEKMVRALESLQRAYPQMETQAEGSMAAFKISNKSKFGALFSTHPSLEQRISTLRKLTSLN